MKKSLYYGALTLIISSCKLGSPSANISTMPTGGTPFNGALNPGVGNLARGVNIDTCDATDSENISFTVSPVQAGPTQFYDNNISSGQKAIFNGSFNENVHIPNQCFTGTVTYSTCAYAQSGTIQFTNCELIPKGSAYQFKANYKLYTINNKLLSSGTIEAWK